MLRGPCVNYPQQKVGNLHISVAIQQALRADRNQRASQRTTCRANDEMGSCRPAPGHCVRCLGNTANQLQMKEAAVTLALLSLLFVLILPCYSQQKDVRGWEKIRCGMSNEDIVRVSGSRLKKLPESEVFFGRHVDYVIPEFELEGKMFTVFFQMDDATNKLCQVLIRLNEQNSRAPRDEIFSRLEASLVRKYGAPVDKRDDRRSSLIDFSFVHLGRTWRFPTTTIELSYGWDNQIDASLLTIRYFQTKAMRHTTPGRRGAALSLQ